MAAVPRRLSAQLVLVATIGLASAGCIDGELGTPFAAARLDEDVHVTSAAPVAVRHLTAIVPAGAGIDMATIKVLVTQMEGDRFEFPDGVTVSVRPDDTSVLEATQGTAEASKLPGALLRFAQCRAGCHGGLTIIVRGGAGPASTEDLRVVNELVVAGVIGSRSTPGSTPTLVDDPGRHFEGAPEVATVSTTIEASLTAERIVVHLDLKVHAAGAVVGDARRRSAVGSLLVRVLGLGQSHVALASDHLTLGQIATGGRSQALAPESSSVDVDWLGSCPASGDCDAIFRVDLSYPLMVAAARAAATNATGRPPTVPDSFRVEVGAIATLEAFDGRPVASGSLTLEATPSR